jgi:hypothetical protein
MTEDTISQENLDVLISGLSNSDLELASRILNFIGDLTRQSEYNKTTPVKVIDVNQEYMISSDGNRDLIGGQQEIVEKIVSFLFSDSNAMQFAARSVANLSFQHGNITMLIANMKTKQIMLNKPLFDQKATEKL